MLEAEGDTCDRATPSLIDQRPEGLQRVARLFEGHPAALACIAAPISPPIRAAARFTGSSAR